MTTPRPAKVKVTMRRVAKHISRREYAAALQQIRSLDRKIRESSAIMYCESSALMHLNRWQEALQLLDALANIDSSRPAVLLDLATCLIEVERDREALNVLAFNQEKLYGLAAYHVLLARVAARHWKLSQAHESVQNALAIDPQAQRLIDKIADLKAVL